MTIYDIAILLILILAVVMKPVGLYHGCYQEHNSKQYLLIVGVILVLIPGLRDHTVGLDTFQYEHFWKYLPDNLLTAFKESRFEEGYILLNHLLRNTSFIIVQLVVSALLIGLSFHMVREYSPMIWFSCILFVLFVFYYRCFNEMRQAVALGIVCFSLKYIVNKRLKPFLLCLCLAAMFHRTSIIFLPAIILIYLDKFKWWQICGLMLALVFITMYSGTIIQSLLPFFDTDYSNIMDNEAGGWGLFFLQILTFSLALFRFKYLSEDRTNLVLLYLIGIATILFPICHMNPMLFRIQDYYWIFMIIFVPRILCTFNNQLVRIVGVTIYSVIAYFFLFVNIFSEHNQLIPYIFYW